jgi:hypothetical protein
MHVDRGGLSRNMRRIYDERMEPALKQYSDWKNANWARFLEIRQREAHRLSRLSSNTASSSY